MSESYLSKQRLLLLGSIFFLSAFWGFHSALAFRQQSVDILLSFLIAIVVTQFCMLDAKVHHKPIPTLAGWLILVIWPLAVPVCLLWVYGLRKSWLVVLSFVGVIAAYCVGAIVASVLAYL